MIVLLLRLYWEFLLIGMFSMGGGMATVPFLFDPPSAPPGSPRRI